MIGNGQIPCALTLVARLFSGENDTTANELLKAIFRGYPAENVRRLVRSAVPQAVKAGAWILSELGPDAARFLASDVAFLLQHDLQSARFFALDAVLSSAMSKDGAVVSRAVMRIRDTDRAVRWKAMQFLSRADADVLRSSIPFISDPEVGELIVWLTNEEWGDQRVHDVKRRLDDPHPVRRLFAAAAAARLAPTDPRAIERAADAGDDEVRDFAQTETQAGWKRIK